MLLQENLAGGPDPDIIIAHGNVAEPGQAWAAIKIPDATDMRGAGQKIYPLREGHMMKPSTKDQAAGDLHEVKGKIKEQVGKAIHQPKLENEGTSEKIAGAVRKKVGQVEKVLGN